MATYNIEPEQACKTFTALVSGVAGDSLMTNSAGILYRNTGA